MDGRGLSSSHWQQQGKEQQQEEQELGGGGGRTGDQEAEIVKIAYTNAQSVLNKLNELSANVLLPPTQLLPSTAQRERLESNSNKRKDRSEGTEEDEEEMEESTSPARKK